MLFTGYIALQWIADLISFVGSYLHGFTESSFGFTITDFFSVLQVLETFMLLETYPLDS